MDSLSKRLILEDYLRFRVKAKPDDNHKLPQVPYSKSLARRVTVDPTGNSVNMTIEALNTIRTLSRDRSLQYKAYDEMEADATISSALDMYADDATQYDTSGRRIWIESDDSNIRDSAMYYLDLLRIEDNCWDHIRSLCKYGDLYLETFREKEESVTRGASTLKIYDTQDKNKSGYLEEYIEAAPDPSIIYDLQYKGKSAGFLQTPQEYSYDANSNEYNRSLGLNIEDMVSNKLWSPDKFIHITLRRDSSRYPETITLKFGKDEITTYRVKRGKSTLHDIYKSFQELSLLEDSLILNRVNKSAIIRLLQVEVGDMPKNQVSLILRKLKDMMEQKFIINKNTSEVRSTVNGGPLENIIYIPTRNGKGAITAQTLGGDVDVKSIADIEYVEDKVYSGLKIPKQMLGKSTEGEGLSGDSSLSKKDSRYARTIKAIQSSYISGITDLLNMFFLDKGLDSYVNKFKVRMVSPSTIEDSERDETASTRLDIADKILSMIKDNLPEGASISPVINWVLSSYIGGVDELAQISESIFGENESDDPDEMAQLDIGDVEDDEDYMDNPSGMMSDISSTSSDAMSSSGFGSDESIPEMNTPEPQPRELTSDQQSSIDDFMSDTSLNI